MTLDVPSLIAYTTASLAIMSGLLLTVWLTRNTPGWLLWCSLALFMGVCGSMLLGHPALLPGIWGDRLGATFVVLAYGLTWQSVRAFYRRSPVTPYIILIAGGWLLLSCAIGAYWHLAVLSVAIRVMLIAVFNGLACYELWRSRQERLPSWTILFGLFLGAAMLSVTRAALVGVLPAPLGALPTTAWAAAAYITAGMTQALVMTVFMIALMGERAAFAGNRLASYDALTGVFNRRSWEEQAERFVTRSRDTGRPLTILMFDLDHFKQVNDRFGHQVGDRVIQVAARLAEQTLRSQDRVFVSAARSSCACFPIPPSRRAFRQQRGCGRHSSEKPPMCWGPARGPRSASASYRQRCRSGAWPIFSRRRMRRFTRPSVPAATEASPACSRRPPSSSCPWLSRARLSAQLTPSAGRTSPGSGPLPPSSSSAGR